MRTNVVLDDRLVEEAFTLTTARTKRQLLDEALREFIRVRRKKDLFDLTGKLRLSDDYDPKQPWSRADVGD